MKFQDLLSAAKNVACAVVGLIGKITTSAAVGSVIKLGLFTGVAIGTAIAVGKAINFFKEKNNKAEEIEEDAESLLFTGLRLSQDDFKDSRMHPSMEIIENFNNTFEQNVRDEFLRPTEENKRFIKQLRKVKKDGERRKRTSNIMKKLCFDINSLSNKYNLMDEFYNHRDEYPIIGVS